jgi:hypothetical protein
MKKFLDLAKALSYGFEVTIGGSVCLKAFGLLDREPEDLDLVSTDEKFLEFAAAMEHLFPVDYTGEHGDESYYSHGHGCHITKTVLIKSAGEVREELLKMTKPDHRFCMQGVNVCVFKQQPKQRVPHVDSPLYFTSVVEAIGPKLLYNRTKDVADVKVFEERTNSLLSLQQQAGELKEFLKCQFKDAVS